MRVPCDQVVVINELEEALFDIGPRRGIQTPMGVGMKNRIINVKGAEVSIARHDQDYIYRYGQEVRRRKHPVQLDAQPQHH